MALEKAGDVTNFKIDKLIGKLQKKFPDYDFSKPAPLDRKCKVVVEGKKCNQTDKITYFDLDGNECCGHSFKLQDENVPHAYENRTCNAVLSTAEERKQFEQGEIW